MQFIHKHLLSILAVFILSACGAMAPSMLSKQSECEKRFTSFPDIFSCTKQSYTSDKFARNDDASVKLYLLKGEELSEKVRNKQLSDIEAKTQWQQLYVQLSNQEVANSAAAVSKFNAIRNRQTICTPVGNTVQCATY